MENLQENIIRNVKALRKSRGFTQEKLAGRIGKSVFTISQLERGATKPGVDTLVKIAGALDSSLNELVADNPAIQDATPPEDQKIVASIWAELQGQSGPVLTASLKAIRAIKEVR